MSPEQFSPEGLPRSPLSQPLFSQTIIKALSLTEEEKVFNLISNGGALILSPEQGYLIDTLLKKGLIQKIDNINLSNTKTEFEHIQDTLKIICDTLDIIRELQLFLAPRQLLGLRFSRTINLQDRSQEFGAILSNLAILKEDRTLLTTKEPISTPEDVKTHLTTIENMLKANSDDCRKRLRNIEKNDIKQSSSLIANIQPFGYFRLTKQGERLLPEHSIVEHLQTAINTISGSHKTRIDDYSHLSEDARNLIPFFLTQHSLGKDISEKVNTFEDITKSYERLPQYRHIQSFVVKNAFLIRLIRYFESTPKGVFTFLNPDRTKHLLEKTRQLIGRYRPSDWDMIYMLDIFLTGSHTEITPLSDESMIEKKGEIFSIVLETLKRAVYQDEITSEELRQDGQLIRLAINIHQDILKTSIPLNPALIEGRTKKLLLSSQKAKVSHISNFPANGALLIHGFHLARLSGFRIDTIPDITQKFERFSESSTGELLSAQAELHLFTCLEKLEEYGVSLDANTFRQMVQRIHQRLGDDANITRITRSQEQLEYLALNLASIAAFGGNFSGTSSTDKDPLGNPIIGEIPLCGVAFGTLFIV